MDRKRFTLIRGGRDARPPAAEAAVDLVCVPRDRWRRTLELRRGDEVVGVLRREGLIGFRAVAEASGTTWVVDRINGIFPSVLIYCDGAEIGVYEDDDLVLHSGRYPRRQGRWLDSAGQVLLRDRGDRVRVEPAGLALPEHLLLALLSVYLKQVDAEPPEEE